VSAIELRDAGLVLGGRAVLERVSLAVPENRFVGVLGPNGAGKTTLMRALLGLVPAARGTIRVLGAPARRGNPAIGYLPQTRAATATGRLRGRDLLLSAWAGHRWGLPLAGADARREVARALSLVDGTALAARPFAELSGGERQRLRLAQALLSTPRLLLLDEPLISLDPRHQQAVVDLVRDLQRTLRLTVLFSAHELNPLLGALDLVLYLGRGQAALGTVAEVVTAPVLSRLYGTEIEVVHLRGRIFVMAGGTAVEQAHHVHA
jgi:zinc/manganese transport system ATP-binding protein